MNNILNLLNDFESFMATLENEKDLELFQKVFEKLLEFTWKLVGDGLPEKSKFYLCKNDWLGDGREVLAFVAAYLPDKKYFITSGIGETDVTHWMELPV